MSFRRSDKSDPGTSRWRTKYERSLLRWLPQEIANSDRSLTYVLLHGDDELGTGWKVDWLSLEAAQEFLAFLEAELPDPTGYEIIAVLRKRLANSA